MAVVINGTGSIAGVTSQDGVLINPPCFQANRTTAGTLPAGAYTQVIFNNVQYNVGNAYNPANGIFTAPVAGYYEFGGGTTFTVSGTTEAIATLYVNDAENAWAGIQAPTRITPQVRATLLLAAGDQVKFMSYSSLAATLVVGAMRCWFEGRLVRLP